MSFRANVWDARYLTTSTPARSTSNNKFDTNQNAANFEKIRSQRFKAQDHKPKVQYPRCKAIARIQSQRSQAKALMRKIQRQRPQAKDLKRYHQKCNTKDPKLKIQSPGFQDMQRPQESLHRVTLAIAIYYIYRLNIYIHILQYVRDACMFARVLV